MDNDICTLSDLFLAITLLIKNYERNINIQNTKSSQEQLYSITDIMKMYPMLSKYLITTAINSGMLPVTWVGHERHFKVSDIEAYLNNHTQNNSSSWRTN